MPTNPQRSLGQYPQSVGNVVLADESLCLLQQSTAEPRPRLQAVGQATIGEVANSDTLAPAIGTIVGPGLSTLLGALIMLILSWIR